LALISFAIYAAFCGFLLGGLMLDGGEANRRMLPIVVLACLVGAAIVTLAGWWPLRRHRDYRDPQLRLRVSERKVEVDWNGQRCALTFDQVTYVIHYQSI